METIKIEQAKKPYDRPEIILERLLEALASSCLPQPPGKTVLPCTTVRS